MGISQVVAVCELYERVAEESGKTPVMYYSVITGIFDEWFAKDVKAKGLGINPDVVNQARMAIAKKVYQVAHDREYLLEWRRRARLAALHRDGWGRRLHQEKLLRKAPEFGRAYTADGLTVRESAEYGPVGYFRGMFVDAWKQALGAITEERART